MKELKSCLVCGGDLKVYCDLGLQPLVNNLKNSADEVDYKYPLVVNECACTHKQLSIAVDRELLFKNYLYQTGISDKHIFFFRSFVCDLGKRGKVLDIGCNDGTLLQIFTYEDWIAYGIEPSKGFKKELIDKNIHTIIDFFPTKEPINDKFDVITAFNVFAHNDDPKTFLIEMAKLLNEDGRIYILTTPARLDNFYHEHISYFTPQSMMKLAEECDVDLISFKEVSMHGKSYLFELGVTKWSVELFEKSIDQIKKEGCVAYGASASEIVLFNHYKIQPEYVVDDNPLKQGKFIPGINSPIVSCETLKNDSRDLTIIVAHNLYDEIVAKIKTLRPNHKDKFERLI